MAQSKWMPSEAPFLICPWTSARVSTAPPTIGVFCTLSLVTQYAVVPSVATAQAREVMMPPLESGCVHTKALPAAQC
ncbi:MAG: hypothetical protein HY898_03125 [Deltaproteobacteria bacterium]|nr:hypothetical protein [Deltaproteobacteria bacterium]